MAPMGADPLRLRASRQFRQMHAGCAPPASLEREEMAGPREIAVEFIEDVCGDLGLSSATFGLAVAYYDAMLRNRDCLELPTELACATCVLIAAKFEELRPPKMRDFLDVASVDVTRDDIKAAELDVLSAIGWKLHAATPFSFAELVCAGMPGVSSELRERVHLLARMAHYEHKMLRFTPAVVAAAAFLAARLQVLPGEAARAATSACGVCAGFGLALPVVVECTQILRHHYDLVKEELHAREARAIWQRQHAEDSNSGLGQG